MSTSTSVQSTSIAANLPIPTEDQSIDNPDFGGLIDTATAMSALVDTLDGQPTMPPSFYIDLEGVNLSRHGTVSILQIYVLSHLKAYLVDIHALGERRSPHLVPPRVIPSRPGDPRPGQPVTYLPRGKVHVASSISCRSWPPARRIWKWLNRASESLRTSKETLGMVSDCIECHASLSAAERIHSWTATKERGTRLFAPERGGSYQVFNERPLSEEIRRYCVQDVHLLPRLWAHYHGRLTKAWEEKAHEASRDRVALSQTPGFNGKGQHMALAPVGWSWL